MEAKELVKFQSQNCREAVGPAGGIGGGHAKRPPLVREAVKVDSRSLFGLPDYIG